jgi:hypothetical protein
MAAGRVQNPSRRTGTQPGAGLGHAVRDRGRERTGHRLGAFDLPAFKVRRRKPLAGGRTRKQPPVIAPELDTIHRTGCQTGQPEIDRRVPEATPLRRTDPGKRQPNDQDESYSAHGLQHNVSA